MVQFQLNTKLMMVSVDTHMDTPILCQPNQNIKLLMVSFMEDTLMLMPMVIFKQSNIHLIQFMDSK